MPDSHAHDRDKANWPKLTEKDWYVFAICLAIGAVIAAFFAALWVFGGTSVHEMKQRIDVVTPFGAIYLALMTFCTVAWRGMVTSRQADQQKRQNDANDEANYSKLLQEAAKLIAEKKKIPQVVAGISTLEILLTEPQKRFAVEAMDLLADLLIDNHGKQEVGSVNRATLRALLVGENKDVWSRTIAKFEKPVATNNYEHPWPRIAGMRSLALVGGTFWPRTYRHMETNLRQLHQVRLHTCDIVKKVSFYQCVFDHCNIRNISDFDFLTSTFKDCDFSGCKIETHGAIARDADMKQGRNYYMTDNPPRDDAGNPMTDIFITYEEFKMLTEDDIPF
ncbi:hypothetical protein [Agrobacterium cavarae]|uniref:hypothetical protein n=1 Tax=Agrobacterium cavarae TaxID=2528239 RepID=UPI0028AA64AA|nr:hypothetical protein [Agrobacterium cavarae]